MSEEEKLKKVKLMLRPGTKNRNKTMRLGKHTITRKMQSFDLDEAEVMELEGKGPKHHFIDDKELAKKKKAEEKDKK